MDVRIICATHQNLQEHIKDGRFREDLYYRVSEITVEIPPLKDREGDAVVIGKALLDRYSRELKRPVKGFDQEAVLAIAAYDWPGNVRELESRIKRAIIMADGSLITRTDLELPAAPEAGAREAQPLNLKQVREAAELKAIRQALQVAGNNITDAASALGITRPTLYNMIEKYGLKAQ